MRYSLNLRKSIFNRIAIFVTSYALRKIDDQYKLLIEWSTAVNRCIERFTIFIELSCSHKIQDCLYESNKCLIIEDIHSHWRFERSFLFADSALDAVVDSVLNSLLQIEELVVARIRDRSAEAKNRTRREEIFDNFTHRISSQFEHV
jgi:hypothetical protein